MKALTCEMCGSTNLIKEGGVFVCQSCGTKYSVEEAKKMMVEGTVDVKGTVKVDTSDELKNLYEIARRAKDSNNSENATKYYDMILVKDPSSWEANFYSVFFKSMGCKIAEINSAATTMTNCLEPVLDLIKQNVTDAVDQKKAVLEVWDKTTDIAGMLFNATLNHYKQFSTVPGQANSSANDAYAIIQLSYKLGDVMLEKYGEDTYKRQIIDVWKQGVEFNAECSNMFLVAQGNIYTPMKELAESYNAKMQNLDPDVYVPETTNSACYVATAVYGSYDCPEVWTLRRFRDFTLDETWYGRLFIKAYYATSPTFVKYFGDVKLFKSQGKKLLDKWVEKLNSKGYECTPYKDKY